MMIRLFDLLSDSVGKNRVDWAHVLIIVVFVPLILITLALDTPVVPLLLWLFLLFSTQAL